MIRQAMDLMEVWGWLDRHYFPLPAESLPLTQANGRILANTISVPCDIPSHDCATINGYALQGQDTFSASDYQPLFFALPNTPNHSPSLPLAYPIVTGQALPENGNAVLPLDYSEIQKQQLWVHHAVAPHEGVLRQGSDLSAGEVLFSAGRILQPFDLAIINALGYEKIDVVTAPLVRVVILGAVHQDMNRHWLSSFIARDGGYLVETVYIIDNKKELAEILTKTDVDLVITTGQTGVGSNDGLIDWFVQQSAQVIASCIAARPCYYAGLGVFGKVPVIFLPGHPANAMAAYDLLAARAIRRAAGFTTVLPYFLQKQKAARKLVSSIGFFDYCRVRFVEQGVISLGMDTRLSHCVRADGVVLIPANREGYAAGAEVLVYCYGGKG